MSIESLIEKAKIYNVSQEYIDSKEKGRLDFVAKFPIVKISKLTLDEYVLGTDNESFCYWLEFKKIEDKIINFGIGGGNASKFGLYKSKNGPYQIGYGENKKALQGQELSDYFNSIINTITLSLKYVSEGRVKDISQMEIPFGKMVLQKILSIYHPGNFIAIGSSNVLIDLAKDINLQNIELNANNLIEINFECKKALDAIPLFHDWPHEKISSFIWECYEGESKKGNKKEHQKYYLVGAYWDESNPADQSMRFRENGIWENGYDDKFTEEVKAVTIGSKIAIKAAFTREKTKSVMAIKAIGTVLENNNDGKTLIVEWDEHFSPFEVDFSGGYWATIKEVSNKDHIKAIFYNNKTNYKTAYLEWLNQANFGYSGKPSSYIRAIDILSELLNNNIFEEDDLVKLDLLYKDLVNEQKNEDGKYFYKNAPSYGNSGFYSASISAYIEFLKGTLSHSIVEEPLVPIKKRVHSKLAQAICVIGDSGVGKTYRVSKTLEREGHKTLFIIIDNMWQHLLFDYSPIDRKYYLTKVGEFIKKAYHDEENNYTIVIDECHKNLEIINDVLLQAISTKRNGGVRFLTLNSLVEKEFDFLPENNGNRVLPSNLGFLFISSKSDIIEGNDDLKNRIEIIKLTESDQGDNDYSIEYLLSKIKKENQSEYTN